MLTKSNLYFFYFFLLQACSAPELAKETLLFDFEDISELNRMEFKCKTRFELSDLYKRHGKSSLKIKFYPTDLVGFILNDIQFGISGNHSLSFWVYNPMQEELILFIRDNVLQIEYNYPIKYGENDITLFLENDSKSKIQRKVSIYLKDINKIVTLYFDNFRLEMLQ